MNSLTWWCPAKVNLYLKVVGRRPDGYHELVTVMQPLSLADELNLTVVGESLALECNHPDLPWDEGNLALRAALAFQESASQKFGLRIRLTKNIPLAAGLGGGSSDAAGVLKGLNRLRGQPLDESRLHYLARQLGADVPFFLMAGPALGRGIGDVLTPVTLPPCWLVLVNPGFAVSTAWVYSQVQPPYQPPDPDFFTRLSREPPSSWLHNDLETVTLQRYPVLADLKLALLQEGAQGALMSGSGPTVFGIFADEGTARQAGARLQATTGHWAAVTQGLV
ncbi:MAG: 4-(cytidine 5'-diphospho)-2-C-methyl-D-erythritol kinase [Deltaproteobacteria bacterium]|nr:4-(cytidine 5'-diphospho)-2-C-methyl-D-erythritol kinase [Deltaproteobacteria bacterium]